MLRRMIKYHDLADRVTLLGAVAAAEVPAAARCLPCHHPAYADRGKDNHCQHYTSMHMQINTLPCTANALQQHLLDCIVYPSSLSHICGSLYLLIKHAPRILAC